MCLFQRSKLIDVELFKLHFKQLYKLLFIQNIMYIYFRYKNKFTLYLNEKQSSYIF